jgi:AraC-like DNA-binding protein
MEPACYTEPVACPVAWYREFAPCEALRADVYTVFSFVPGPTPPPPHRTLLREIAFRCATFCSPQFADGHVSVVFELGRMCDAAGRWCTDSSGLRGTVIGPMTAVGRTEGDDRPEMVGVYFRPARVGPFLRAAISDLTDKTAGIDDLWGTSASRLAAGLGELDEAGRIDRLESTLLARLRIGRQRTRGIDLEGLAASVLRQRGRLTVEVMARAAGISRQHLSREFRERIGITPKLYARLARFQSGLVYAGCQGTVDWADVALDLGYADQSHMIAEFRRFSGLTPRALANRDWFHPFIERARNRNRSRLQYHGAAY